MEAHPGEKYINKNPKQYKFYICLTVHFKRRVLLRFPLTYFLFFFSLVHCFFVDAQPPLHYIETLTTNDGLSSNAVTDVAQDQQGFLWIGTRHGLNRYDGAEAKQFFAKDDGNSISNNTIYRLLPTDSFHLAIATGHGISILDTRNNTFKNIIFPSDSVWESFDNQVFYLEKDKAGNLWAGTPTCLYLLDKTFHLQQTFRYQYSPADIGSKRLHYVYKILPLPSGEVLFSLIDGIKVWNPVTKKLTAIKDDPSSKWYFLKHLSYYQYFELYGRYLLTINYSKKLIDIYDEQTDEHASCSVGKYLDRPDFFISNVSELKDGRLIFSFQQTGFALGKIEHQDQKLILSFDTLQYFPKHNFRTWIKDREENLWATSLAEGLTKISPAKQLFDNKILKDEAGKIYNFDTERFYRIGDNLFIASYGGGFFKWNVPSGKMIHHTIRFDSESHNMIWNFRQDSADTLWIGTQHGIVWYNLKNEKTGRLLYPHLAILDSFAITTQFTDSKGIVWMGIGSGNGVCAYDPSQKRFHLYPNEDRTYPFRYPLSIAEDQDSNLWFISDITPHLVKWNRKENRFHKIIIPEFKGTKYRQTGSLYLDKKNGFLWYGVLSAGLVRYNIYTGKIKIYGMDKGLSTDLIRDICPGKNGFLWLATPQGITSFDPADERFVNYRTGDGLPAINFSCLYYNDSSGLMYAGALGNVVYFSPESFKKKKPPMRVKITSLVVNGTEKKLPQNRKIKLSWNQNDVTISFTGINLTTGTENHYAYRLKNNDWIDIGTERQLHFASLKPGHYLFSIRAARKDGDWSPINDQLELIISPPFTQTVWFYLLLLALISGAIYAWYRYRLGQVKKMQNMRSKISHDLHDEIGSRLTNIGLMSRIARQNQYADDQTNDLMNKIEEESQAVSQNMREIIWNINPDNDSLDEAMPRMLHYATELLETKGINVNASIPDLSAVKMNMEQRRDLFLIFKEVIHNIVQHSGADATNIVVTLNEKNFILQIFDNGKGFDKNALPYLNGLNYMQKRANKYRWNLEIASGAMKGTCVTLKIKPA